MKGRRLGVFVLVLTITVFFNSACEKESSVPSVKTIAVTETQSNYAVGGGLIKDDGGEDITSKGVCWSVSENPTIANSKTTDGKGNAAYTSKMTGLLAGVTYHVRAYATNGMGTAYGEDITFTTSVTLPVISTNPVSLIETTTAACGGDVTSDGGSAIIAKGVCWSTSPNPTVDGAKTSNGQGTGIYSSSMSGLMPNTTYYVRAYATNAVGTVYGGEISFKTIAEIQVGADNDNLMLGNPSLAVNSELSANNYLMVKPQFCLSYNNSKQTMNWTSWHVYSGDLGSVSRQDDFRADPALPSSWYHVTDNDYQYSIYGFDRGHMCPSADRTSSAANNSATFLMTNMIPQAPNNNQQTWSDLENYCRSLVNNGNELYIISGPYGQGGASAKGTFNVLASGVTVPSQTWKIVVVLPNGNNDLSRINASTRVIAVVMPNTQACSSYSWSHYKVSVDAVESLTGYDFLSNLSSDIQSVIEAKVDNL